MSDQRRPGQATFAVWLIVGGSLLAIVTAWERIAGLHTVEVQETLQRAVRDQPFGLHIDVASLSTLLRVLCLIGGGASAAAAILGVQVLRRSAGARIALTVLAPLVFVGWIGTAGYFEPLVLAGIATLWLGPTGAWYAGKQPLAPGESRRIPPYPAQQPFEAPAPPTDEPPGATSAPDPLTSSWSGETYPPVRAGERPPALVWACCLTWLFAGLAAVLMTLSAIALQTMSDRQLTDAVRRVGELPSGFTVQDLRSGVVAVCAVAVPVCVVAIVLAVLAYRGRPSWARVALSICSGLAGTICLLLALQNPLLALPGGAAIATTILLSRPEVVGWRR